MCGIVLVPDTPEYSKITASTRGPDATTIKCFRLGGEPYQLRFYRLEVFGGDSASQPVERGSSGRGTHIFACNGEIYNWRKLNRELQTDIQGDCLVAAKLMERLALGSGSVAASSPSLRLQEELGRLHGEFAFVSIHTDSKTDADSVTVARDRYGVRPLYIGTDAEGRFMAVSSMLGVPSHLTHLFRQMQGGTWQKVQLHSDGVNVTTRGRFTPPPLSPLATTKDNAFQVEFLRAVRIRCEQVGEQQKLGVLLSGGMDSVAVLAAMCACIDPARIVAFTVAFGATDTPDVDIASRACEELGVGIHKVITIEDNPEQILSQLRRAIRVLHTFDTTTIRAGTIQNLMYRCAHPIMQEEGIKALLSGEGSDELAGGYQYFKMAPGGNAAEIESQRLLNDIYLYDGLRADRTAGAWGKEIRLPFLDTNVAQAFKDWWTPEERWNGRVEKKRLRDVLASIPSPSFQAIAVQEAIRRPKDALSDSVGRRWVDRLKILAAEYCDEREFPVWSHLPPQTKEQKMYRDIFDQECGGDSAAQIPYYWMPKWQTEGSPGAMDPSATVLQCFTE